MRTSLFQNCVAVSAGLHAAAFLLFSLFGRPAAPSLEVDLTTSFLGSGPARLGAPKRQVPSAPAGPTLPAETPVLPAKAPVSAPPKDWTLPGPETKAVEKPAPPPPTPGGAPEGTGTSPLPGGAGQGADYGVPGGRGDGGAALKVLPRLLNRDEVLRNLQRFYPESERRAGREGTVLVNLHIAPDGSVSSADVTVSAGPAFDAAAQQVARLMRFSPAENALGPVAVKVPQSMVFKLSD